MKKSTFTLIGTFLLFCCTSHLLLGQDESNFNTTRGIKLKSDSEVQKISLSVSGEFNYLIITIGSQVWEGDLTMEIYDPKGEKQGNYSVGCQLPQTKQNVRDSQSFNPSDSKEVVGGRITRSIKHPIKGDWIVKIIPKKATGIIDINVTEKNLENIKD